MEGKPLALRVKKVVEFEQVQQLSCLVWYRIMAEREVTPGQGDQTEEERLSLQVVVVEEEESALLQVQQMLEEGSET